MVVLRFLAVLLLLVGVSLPALGQGLSGAQQQALSDRVASFGAAVQGNDMASIMSVVPPKVLAEIAAQFGVTPEQLVASAQQQIDELMGDMTLQSFNMDLENAAFVTPADGLPYGLIPTETVIDLGAGEGKVRSRTTTLGLLDGETWYLMRIDDARQVAVVKQVYPFLADVEFSAGTAEPVTE